MITTPMRLRKNPTFAISGIRRYPLPNIIAFGGVATGSMNAQDADIAAGIISKKGCMDIATAIEPSTGIIMVVVAVFEVTSVKKVMSRQIQAIIRIGCIPPRKASLSPIH